MEVGAHKYEYFLNVDIETFADIAKGLCLEVQKHLIDMMTVPERNYAQVHTHADKTGAKCLATTATRSTTSTS